jgi:hypothetical protein
MSLVATTTTAVLVTTVAATARVIWHQQKSWQWWWWWNIHPWDHTTINQVIGFKIMIFETTDHSTLINQQALLPITWEGSHKICITTELSNSST